MSAPKDRRSFLKVATIGVGGAIGAAVVVPLARYISYPVGRTVVGGPDAPVDVLPASALDGATAPIKVELVADRVRDAWAVGDRVAVGGAWVSKEPDGRITAFSSACPHLGCAIAYAPDADQFRCPCHRSAFARTGEKLSGPSKRGLDPLPVTVEDGRVKLRLVRYRPDIPEREPV